jgi:hypothetical protein
MCGLFKRNNRICHALLVLNSMKGVGVVANVCWGLVRKRGGVMSPLQDVFTDHTIFPFTGPLEVVIKRGKGDISGHQFSYLVN